MLGIGSNSTVPCRAIRYSLCSRESSAAAPVAVLATPRGPVSSMSTSSMLVDEGFSGDAESGEVVMPIDESCRGIGRLCVIAEGKEVESNAVDLKAVCERV